MKMPRDMFGNTKPFNDDRPFVLEAYDHTVQTGPNPVKPVEPVVEQAVEPAAEAVVDGNEAEADKAE